MRKTLLLLALLPSLLCAQISLDRSELSPKTTTPGCPTGSENPTAVNATLEYEILLRTNAYRVASNLPPLKWNTSLNRAARFHAKDMAAIGYIAHPSFNCADGDVDFTTPPTGCSSTCTSSNRVDAFYNFMSFGENIAWGSTTSASTMTAWQNSPGHNANLLDDTRKELGVGYTNANSTTGPIWVQNFGYDGLNEPVIVNNDSTSTPNPDVRVYTHRPDNTWNELRLSNDNTNWTNWGTFPANGWTNWTLASGSSGTRTVFAQIRKSTAPATVRSSQDDITLSQTFVGRDQARHSKLALLPNPTTDVATLRGTGLLSARLTDLQGRTLTTVEGRDAVLLSLAHLPAGVYLVHCDTQVLRLVKH